MGRWGTPWRAQALQPAEHRADRRENVHARRERAAAIRQWAVDIEAELAKARSAGPELPPGRIEELRNALMRVRAQADALDGVEVTA